MSERPATTINEYDDINSGITDALNPPNKNSYGLSGRIMLTAIVMLFAVVVLMVCLHIYARWYLHRARRLHQRRRPRRRNTTTLVFYTDEPNSAGAAARGLDPALLGSLPVLLYSLEKHPHVAECAICLSEFEENEKVRLLPKCNHGFHLECIDMWFHSHSTCPLCRSPVEARDCTVSVCDQRGDIESGFPGTSTGLCDRCQGEEHGSSSINRPNQQTHEQRLGERRKVMELERVTVEVPTRRCDFGEGLRLSSPGLKSPVSARFMSLKRILSLNAKGVVSPGVGTSRSELDVESGRDESTQVQTPR